MKKTTKYIVATLVILIVLGGGFLALMMTEPEVKDVESSTSSESSETSEPIILLDYKQEELDSILISNQYGENNYVQNEEKSEFSDGVSYIYKAEGYENYTLNSTFVYALRAIIDMNAIKEIGEVDSLEQYGLQGDTAVNVQITLKNGDKEELVFGNEAGSTKGNYLLYNNKVYIVKVDEKIYLDIKDNINKYFYEAIVESAEDVVVIDNIKFTGTNFPEEVIIVDNGKKGTREIIAPLKNVDANVPLFTKLPDALEIFKSDKIAVLNATEEDLEECGLLEPMTRIEFEMDGEVHSLTASSKTVNNMRYILIDDIVDTIYLSKVETCAVWAENNLYSVRGTYVFMPGIVDVETLDIEIDGKKETLEFEKIKDEDRSTEESPYYEYKVHFDGKTVEYKDVTSFYMSIIGVSVLNMDQKDCEENASIKFTFNYYDGGENTLEYKKSSDGKYMAFLDGQYTATVRDTSLKEFISAFDTLKELAK